MWFIKKINTERKMNKWHEDTIHKNAHIDRMTRNKYPKLANNNHQIKITFYFNNKNDTNLNNNNN